MSTEPIETLETLETPLINETEIKQPFLKKHFNKLVFFLFIIFLLIAFIQKYFVTLKYDESISLSDNIENQKKHSSKIIIILIVSIILDILLLLFIIKYSNKNDIIRNIILYGCIILIFILSISSIILCTKIESGDTMDIYNNNKKYLDTVEILNFISGLGPRIILLIYMLGGIIIKTIKKYKNKGKHNIQSIIS